MFPKDHASQILSKGPVSTKELQEYSKFGGWYVEFMAMSALAQQKQTGGKGIWCSRGLYFGSSPWHGLHTCTPRSVLWRASYVAQMAPRCKPGRLLGQAGALPQEECALIWTNRLLQVHHPLPALPRASILWSETDIKSEVMHSTLAGQSLNWCTEQFFQKHDILNPSLKPRARLLLILALPWNAHLSLSIILSAYLPCLGFLKIQFRTLVLKCEGFHIGIERKINWKKKFTYTSKIA